MILAVSGPGLRRLMASQCLILVSRPFAAASTLRYHHKFEQTRLQHKTPGLLTDFTLLEAETDQQNPEYRRINRSGIT
jgi:hypothetical protein